MPATAGPILRSPTIGFSRLDRVKLATEFMRSPLGQRIKNALVNRANRAAAMMGVSVESIISGSCDLNEAIRLLSEGPPPPPKKKDDEKPELAPGQGMPDPRLADLASGAIDLQPEDGPTLDDLYDSAILRVNAADALDFFLASDIEHDLGAFLLFFSPLMPVQQSAQLLGLLKEIMPGTQVVQGPVVGPPPAAAGGTMPGEDGEDDEEEPSADFPDQEDEPPEDDEEGDETDDEAPDFPDQEDEPPEDGEGDEFDDEEVPSDDDGEDEEEPEGDEDEEDEFEEADDTDDAAMQQAPQADAGMPSAMPQFDTENPHGLPWVFLVTSDEVNLATDGSVSPPEDDQQKGITGFPEPSEEPATGGAVPGGDGEEPGDGEEVPPGEEEEPGDEEVPPGEEEPVDGDEEVPPDEEDPEAAAAAAAGADEPGQGDMPGDEEPGEPGAGEEPGDGEMPGDGGVPGPEPDDEPGVFPPDEEPDDEFPPDDEEEPEDDDDEDEEEDDETPVAVSRPGILYDSVTALLGEPPK